MRSDWVAKRAGDRNKTQMHYARRGIFTEEMAYVAERERVQPEVARSEVARGRLVIPANGTHVNLAPLVIGLALGRKLNANTRNSAVTTDVDAELRNQGIAVKDGAE